MKILVCALALLLIFTGMGLAIETVEKIPDQLLDKRVRVVFEEKLPSGQYYLEGMALIEENGWLFLVNEQGKIYWCRISRIVYIEILRINQGGEDENISLDAGGAADLDR